MKFHLKENFLRSMKFVIFVFLFKSVNFFLVFAKIKKLELGEKIVSISKF